MFSWPAPRRGSRFTSSTSSAIVLRAVADDVAGHPVGGGDELAVDRRAAGGRRPGSCSRRRRPSPRRSRDLEGVGDLGVGREVHRDAAAVVAVDRLHHHRVADVVRGVDRVLGVADVDAASAPAGRGRRGAGCRAPCRRRSRPRCARSGWSAPPRCASGTCPGRPGSGWRRSAAPRGCRAPRPPGPAPAPRARASGGRRSGRSRRSPRRCRSRSSSRGAISSRMMLRATSPASSPTSSDS